MDTIILIGIGMLGWILDFVTDIFTAAGTWKGAAFIGFYFVISVLQDIRDQLHGIRYKDD